MQYPGYNVVVLQSLYVCLSYVVISLLVVCFIFAYIYSLCTVADKWTGHWSERYGIQLLCTVRGTMMAWALLCMPLASWQK